MLIICPECNSQVSDFATSCPHCGYPLMRKGKNTTNKPKRLPNGFGQISKINNRNLRKPYRVMITIGKDPCGKPICKPLKPTAYFSSYNEAYKALVEYNKDPYDLINEMTMEDLYNTWFESYFSTNKHPTTKPVYAHAWTNCSSIAKLPVKELRSKHIKTIIDSVETAGAKKSLKFLFNLMLDYALSIDLISRNYSRTLSLNLEDSEDVKHHISFTDSEMEELWKHVSDLPYVDVLLIDCYSGLRPQELCSIQLNNVDLENGCITGGMKTKAGKSRVIPIHHRIFQLVNAKYNESMSRNGKYLLTTVNGKQLTYKDYRAKFDTIRELLKLDPSHLPHDGRKQFVTMAKKYNVDEYAIKLIVGHKITDITESIYTDRDLKWLKTEIEKIQ